MFNRVVILFGVLVVFVAGGFAVHQYRTDVKTPLPPVTREAPPPAAPVAAAPQPAEPAPQTAALPVAAVPAAEPAPPAAASPPVVVDASPAQVPPAETSPAAATAPPAETPAPVVTAPPVETSAPVVATAPAETPASAVSAPPAEISAPAVSAPPAETSAPVVSAPPVETSAPIVATAPRETPASAVSTSPAETPAPVAAAPSIEAPVTIVTAPPMPPSRPSTEESKMPAKILFASKQLPSLGKAMAIGYYPRGCLSGGVPLPVTGPTWQVMRLSRNRNWGHPELVKFLERFAPLAAKATGWNGIMIGDMAQPRGGPLPFGHLSHQIGLDVDIWFMPMPEHVLSDQEREKTSAINLVADDWKHVNPKTWSPQDIAFIKTAAVQPEVERVLVNAAIKQELCRVEDKSKDGWMSKVRPWYGHNDHIHVRLKCPADSPNCRKQPSVPGDDGCNAKALDYWFSDKVLHPPKPTTPAKPPKALTLADLPPACKEVLDAPSKTGSIGADKR